MVIDERTYLRACLIAGGRKEQEVDAELEEIFGPGLFDSVSAGNQNRLAVFLRQCAQCAESAQSTHHFRAAGFLHHTLDTVDERVACINIYAGIFIAERGFIGHCEISTHLR